MPYESNRLFLDYYLTFFLHPSYAQCRKAQEFETPEGANEFILMEDIKQQRFIGKVFYADMKPVKNAVVEVFAYHSKTKKDDVSNIPSRQKRIAACVTNTDGRFSFNHLKAGKYFLRAGTHDREGMQAMHAVILYDPKNKNFSKTRVELILRPGW